MRRLRLPLLSRSILALGLLLALPIPSAADEEIPPQPMKRRFPQGQFCGLPITLRFNATAEGVEIHFVAQVYVDDNGTRTWTNQSIDNVTLALTSVVAANFGGPPTDPDSSCSSSPSCNCYIGDIEPVKYFYFNRPVPTLLTEIFDTNPGPRGWDLSNGGYFNLDSGPRNPETDSDLNGGSLGLGTATPDSSLATQASTSIAVTGLTGGQSYDVGAWWNAEFVPGSQDVVYLTVSVTTLGGTPVVRRSWGSLKAGYR